MKFRHKNVIKNKLSEYLQMTRNINTSKLFNCINASHTDKKPSMGFKNDMCYCFTCNARYDIYNIIGQDYGLNTFQKQYEKACLIFGLDDDFVKAKYKASMKDIKNNYVDIRRIEEEKEQRYNNFCNRLVDKRREFIQAMELLSKYKDSKVYQDYRFKADYIEKFLNQIIEYNQESLDLINNFNKLFEYEYNNFQLVLDAI